MVKKSNINLGVIMGGGIILLILVFLYMNSAKVKEKYQNKPYPDECVDFLKSIGSLDPKKACYKLYYTGICSTFGGNTGLMEPNVVLLSLQGINICHKELYNKFKDNKKFINGLINGSLHYTTPNGLPFGSGDGIESTTGCPRDKYRRKGNIGPWGQIPISYCA